MKCQDFKAQFLRLNGRILVFERFQKKLSLKVICLRYKKALNITYIVIVGNSRGIIPFSKHISALVPVSTKYFNILTIE